MLHTWNEETTPARCTRSQPWWQTHDPHQLLISWTVSQRETPQNRPPASTPQETFRDLKPATNYRVTVRAVNSKFGPGPATTVPVRTRGNHDDSKPPGAVVEFDVEQVRRVNACRCLEDACICTR